MARIGVDVGGTNTDFVLECAKGVFYHKVPTTLKNQSIGVVEGVKGVCGIAGIDVAEVEVIVHGTTTATNITIEHNGSETGMLTTRGFRDILHIGRHKRPYNFSLHFNVPWQSQPLVKRRNRIAVTERIMPPDGRVEAALDEQEVRAATRLFRKRGINSIVIGFMFSFLNNAHERRAREIVLEEMPDAYVTLSSEVANVMREYERFSTAAMNCFVGPKTSFYLRDLETKLREAGVHSKLRIMQSNGGVSTVEACSARAVRILMSGPAGGVIGGASEGVMAGERNIITVDIGGTSADISTIPDGRLKIMNPRDTYVSGHPVLTPMIDLVTIGAGGGSVAYIDEAGAFHVGPRSAGSEPGPACYGRGGTEPTVADALVVLGIIDPTTFFGGRYTLDPQKSHDAIATRIAAPLGLDPLGAAAGIYDVVTAKMADLIRKVTVESGHDPREFCLLSYGGAGGAHCVDFAAQLGIRRVIVPYAAPVFSALGVALSDIAYRHVRSAPVPLDGPATVATANTVFAELSENAQADMRASGIDPGMVAMRYGIEMRYVGQMNEVPLAWPSGRFAAADLPAMRTAFEALYQQRYGAGTFRRETPLEIISFRAEAVAATEKPRFSALFEGNRRSAAAPRRRKVYMRKPGWIETAVFAYDALTPDRLFHGPAIVERESTTVWLPPGAQATLDVYGNLAIDLDQ